MGAQVVLRGIMSLQHNIDLLDLTDSYMSLRNKHLSACISLSGLECQALASHLHDVANNCILAIDSR